MAKPIDQPYSKFDSFEQFFAHSEQRPGYWVELAKLDFTREIFDRMKVLGVSKSQLATKLEGQPALVTRLLSGRNNFELATMVRIARALDCEFRCHLQPIGTKTCWIDVLNEEAKCEPVAAWNPAEFQRVKFEPNVLNYESIPAAA
jgi:transcriptional regulator with XRE-family HTH domain